MAEQQLPTILDDSQSYLTQNRLSELIIWQRKRENLAKLFYIVLKKYLYDAVKRSRTKHGRLAARQSFYVIVKFM